MPKLKAGDEQIVQLTNEYTWMGGDPAGMSGLLRTYEFDKSTLQWALTNVMSSHSCTSTYATALRCKDILEEAMAKLD